MKKIYVLLSAIFMSMPLVANAQLVGQWATKQSPVALGGSAEFRADGTFVLRPDGSGDAPGKYTLEGNRLVMRLDSSPQFPAEGIVEFANKNQKMVIQYAKGPAQEFNRVTQKKKAAK